LTELSWEETFTRFFKLVELHTRFELLRRTPAVEIKKMAMNDILKQYEEVEKPFVKKEE